ncbi:Planctomycete cytochrome C [Stieleria maiorica]|uniref:Planctomycete cytochrome C n=1 Tax=Stieleria maiorica TaxID=2795974 RepID=A0A5B9M950_9BACT|nr:c-type cytochrome domain-containing protein [Stieleria maiorica]QEF96716.1 Planctomycete cytochrome C [Stieleria maiorica]
MSMFLRCPVRFVFAACALAILLGSTSLKAQERTAVDDEGRIVDFQRDIVPILRVRCLECHNEQEAKGDFRVDDAETFLSYVEPEDAEYSTVLADYMLSDDPDMLMPPPSKGGPLSPQELALVRVWIDEGAHWPEDALVDPLSDQASEDALAAPVVAAPKSLLDRVWAFQGFLHPATVHFPIALLLFGAMFVVLGWKWPSLGQQVPLACLLLGALMAIASTAMGWSFAMEKGYGSWTKVDMDSEVFWHRWSGVIVTVTSAVLALVALRAWSTNNVKLERTWKIGLLVVAGMVGAVGHQGGEMTYGKDFYPKAFRILLGTEGQPTDVEFAEEPAALADDEVVAATVAHASSN